MNEFISTYYFSIIIQIASLFIQLYGYKLQTPQSLISLKYALNIEFFVSIIELLVYFWIGTNLFNYKSVMKKRYMDWFLTTNSLMISFSFLFLFYNESKNKKTIDTNHNYGVKPKTLITRIRKNIDKYYPIIIFNNLMLLFGYLGEINKISKKISFPIGFLFFFFTFYYLYENFAKFTNIGKKILYGISLIWLLYGISHLFEEKWKNVSYNILDLISKNAFGVTLVFLILHHMKKTKNIL